MTVAKCIATVFSSILMMAASSTTPRRPMAQIWTPSSETLKSAHETATSQDTESRAPLHLSKKSWTALWQTYKKQREWAVSLFVYLGIVLWQDGASSILISSFVWLLYFRTHAIDSRVMWNGSFSAVSKFV